MSQDTPPRSAQEQAHAWFARLRSDQASAADRKAFAEWLAANPDHAHAYAQAERLWQWLEAPGQAVRGRAAARRGRLQTLRRAVLPLAACLLLAAWAGEWLRPWRGDFATGWGETRQITLADGSHITLNSHSRLDLAFGDGRRGVRLVEGEAYFEVAKDPARPFVVSAEDGEATVLGTRFNVCDSGGQVMVTVAEGRVRVDANSGTALLTANRQASYDKSGVSPVAAINADEALAWRQGRLVFKLKPLAAVVDDINRNSRGRIVLVGAGLGERVVSGVFDARRQEQSLATIQATLRLRATRLPGGITLLYP